MSSPTRYTSGGMIMSKVVDLMRPILFSLIASRQVKELVIALLERYAARTDNDVDDLLVKMVREKLLGNS